MSCTNFDNFLKLIEEDLDNETDDIIEEENNKKIYKKNIIDRDDIKNINELQKFKNFKPTNLRVSTITICATINLNKTIKNFVNKDIIIKHCCKKCYEMFIDNHTCVKEICRKGSFYNQQTVIIKLNSNKQVSFKIFWNGKIQITGAKSKEDGYEAIQKFIDILKKLHNYYKNTDEWVVTDFALLELNEFKICLINSDFKVDFKIKRNILYELLKNKYEISVSYEPDYYQGVNSKYYWNKQCINNNYKKGKCYCNNIKCNGKGKGNGNGDCKRVTIAIFQSGKIIITGAQTYLQIKDTYLFINNVLDKEYSKIKREEITIKKTDDIIKKEYIHIKKSEIENFYLYQQLLNS